jgi:dipeptidase D
MHGGHSGIDIHLQRGNAVKLLARILYAAQRSVQLQLASLNGGNKHNAIPREAAAVVVVNDAKALRDVVQKEFDAIKAEFAVSEPNLELQLKEAGSAENAWTVETTSKVLQVLEALPHGVLAMSLDIPGLVETSTNVAVVSGKTGDSELMIHTSSRSSVMSALRETQRRIRAIAELAGASVDEGDGYPGWKPEMSSKLLQVVRDVHTKVQKREPEVVAVHAGLECGIIGEKIAGMDMISFGPQIEHPHSPQERVEIGSVARFWELLKSVLERLAK